MVHERKIALVTGGNRGIGFELVKQLSFEGFKGGPSAPRTPKQAAESILWLTETGPNGRFYRNGRQIEW